MIDISPINWATKDFPREINEIKYLSSVMNDIHNQFNILKNSVDLENKQQEIFFKGLVTNSKYFMNEISSFNFNQVDQPNLINISMNFGNLFDLIGKIFSDENKIFNDKISILFNEFNPHLTQATKIINEFLNFPFKDFSYYKKKKLQISEKCGKSFKEIELCLINSKTENYSKEKTNEKIIHIFSDFEEKLEYFKIIKQDIHQIETILEELLKSIFHTVMKISYSYLNFFKNFSEEIFRYKKSFSEKVLNLITVTIESLEISFASDGLSDYEIKIYEEKYTTASEVINYFFSKNNSETKIEILDDISIGSNSSPITPYQAMPRIEVKNIQEISENLSNFITCIPHVTTLKKKILTTFSKFLQEIFRHTEILIQNFTKIQKNVYIFKPVHSVSTSHSYLLNTSLNMKYESIKNLFDFYFKKIGEIFSQKNTFGLICNSIDLAIKEINNEESNFVGLLGKLNKDYTHYRGALTKLLIGKEKTVTQIANNKETLNKLEEASQSLSKIEISLENLKFEETKINEQISELNSNYKKYLEEFVENFRKNYFYEYKQRDSIRFRELFRDVMLNFLSLFQTTYSAVFSQFNHDVSPVKTKSDCKLGLKEDLTAIFWSFKEEYLNTIRGQWIYEEIFAMVSLHTLGCREVSQTANSNEACASSCDKSNLDQSCCFVSKEDPSAYLNVETLQLTSIMKQEQINALRENDKILKAKGKAHKNSASFSSKDIVNLYNLITINDETIKRTFYCFYPTGFNFLIPGILFVSNKRIVFQPFLNMKEILSNKKENNLASNNPIRLSRNCIELLKYDLTSIREKNKYVGIEIKTATEEFTFLFLLFALEKTEPNTSVKYIEDILSSVKESFGINDLSEIQESFKSEKEQNNASDIINKEILSSPVNINVNYESDQAVLLPGDEYYSKLIDLNFFNRVNDFNKSQLDFFTKNNLIRVKFNETFVKDKPLLGNSTDSYIPIHLIYKYIYDNQVQCCHDDYNKAKTFILNLKEIRKDYNISFNNLSQTAANIPRYYSDPFDYTAQLFSSNTNTDKGLKEFLDTMKDNFGVVLEYEYNYTHPMKKKFMGPSKLDMNDKYKITFLSPLCLIVEISSFMSGFMLMDTFYTVAQYKYEADLFYDRNLKRIAWKTKVSASFAFEFVKECWFRNKIESNGLVENEEYIRDFVLVHAVKVLEERSLEYYRTIKKEQEVKQDYDMLMNSPEINVRARADAMRGKDNEKNLNRSFDLNAGEYTENSVHNSKKETNSKVRSLDSYTGLTITNLLILILTFSVVLTASITFSYISPQSGQIKELFLYLILSAYTVLLYNLSQKVSDLQKRIKDIESK